MKMKLSISTSSMFIEFAVNQCVCVCVCVQVTSGLHSQYSAHVTTDTDSIRSAAAPLTRTG